MSNAPQQVTQFSGGLLRFEDGSISKVNPDGSMPKARFNANQINLVTKSDLTADDLAAKLDADKKTDEAAKDELDAKQAQIEASNAKAAAAAKQAQEDDAAKAAAAAKQPAPPIEPTK